MNWFGKKKKDKPPKQRAAPPARKHPPHYASKDKGKAPKPPTVHAQYPRRQPPPNYRSQSQQQTPIKKVQQQLAQPHSAQKNSPSSDDDDDDDDGDMFAGLDEADDDSDDDDDNNTNTNTPQNPQTSTLNKLKPNNKGRQRAISVEELQKLSDEEALTLALNMSLQPNPPKNAKLKAKPNSTSPPINPQKTNYTHNISPQHKPIRNNKYTNRRTPIKGPDTPPNDPVVNPGANSAFGFTLGDNSSTKPAVNDNTTNANDKGNSASATSAFGFTLSGSNDNDDPPATNTTVDADNTQDDDDDDDPNDLFGGLVKEREEELSRTDNAHNNNANANATVNDYTSTHNSTKEPTPSFSASYRTTTPPYIGTGVGVNDKQDILSQLKRAQNQFERSRKRIWAQIKQCIQREQIIKERQLSLNEKLVSENRKKEECIANKKIALQTSNFDAAERIKNISRRCIKNIQDINYSLTKCNIDLNKISSDKTEQEDVYMNKSKKYQSKLNDLYSIHESTMQQFISDEFDRIEKEEKQFKEKLDRTEREIQLDDENIEKCKENLEEIEDQIRNDVSPHQEQLDFKLNNKKELNLEIEELNKQLAIKQEQVNNIDNDLFLLNNEIQKVRRTYKSQTDEIIEEQMRYEQSKQSFVLKKNELVISIQQLNEETNKNKKIEEDFENELNRIKLKMSKINISFERFQNKKLRYNEWNREEQILNDKSIKLNKEIDNIKYEIEKYDNELNQITSKCTQHRSTVSTIDTALPILLSDKQTAVNNENYLDAGKIHKQIQMKISQKEKSLDILKTFSDKQNNIKVLLSSQQKKQIKLTQELNETKIKIHKQRFELLMDIRITLKESLKSFTDNDDMISLNDDVEISVLNTELDECQKELNYFNKLYGWNIDYNDRNLVQTIEGNNNNNNNNNNGNAPGSNVSSGSLLVLSPSPSSVLSGSGAGGVASGSGSVVIQNAEEHKDNTVVAAPVVVVVKTKSVDELNNEISILKDDLVKKEDKKKGIQKAIMVAVSNDDYGLAGQLAPKKKMLIKEINTLKEDINKLEIELENAIQLEKEQKEKEKEKQKQIELEKEKEKQKQKEIELEKQKQIDLDKDKDIPVATDDAVNNIIVTDNNDNTNNIDDNNNPDNNVDINDNKMEKAITSPSNSVEKVDDNNTTTINSFESLIENNNINDQPGYNGIILNNGNDNSIINNNNNIDKIADTIIDDETEKPVQNENIYDTLSDNPDTYTDQNVNDKINIMADIVDNNPTDNVNVDGNDDVDDDDDDDDDGGDMFGGLGLNDDDADQDLVNID